jgi:4-hydroxybenzoate polyprenyltransferase
MCGFVINDLHDIEKDAENHPARPLPSEQISPIVASIIYFALLTISLVTIKLYVAPSNVYLYFALLLGLINYNYVVEYIPYLKNPYVSAIGVIPLLILSSLLPSASSRVPIIATALFLFLFGREMLMDVQDARGDSLTLVKRLGITTSEQVAFALKITGSVVLAAGARRLSEVALAGLVLLGDFVFLYSWRKQRLRRVIIFVMKLQLLLGIYFLI